MPITGNTNTCTEFESVWQNDCTWQRFSDHGYMQKNETNDSTIILVISTIFIASDKLQSYHLRNKLQI